MTLRLLRGQNFSGRTQTLREWVGLPHESSVSIETGSGAFIGLDTSNAFSGIASGVKGEIELLARSPADAIDAQRAMEALGFGYCLEQSPFTLSGGEQVVAASIAASSARPRRLAIDGALEQLDADARQRLLAYLAARDCDVMFADNRAADWYDGDADSLAAPTNAPAMRFDTPLPEGPGARELEVVGLTHWYIRGRRVLNDLSFKLRAGQSYALRGPNGSGKTTLSKILCGLIRPRAGEIRLDGERIEPWRTPGRWVGYHFQNPDYQIFTTRVCDQVGSADPSEPVARWSGLDACLDAHPLDLPYVLRKRLALATCLSVPRLAVLDEPTLGQDDANALDDVRVRAMGRATIVISHSRRFDSLARIDLGGGSHDTPKS